MNVPHENMTESIVVVDVRHEEEHKDEDPADLTMSFFPENLKQKKKWLASWYLIYNQFEWIINFEFELQLNGRRSNIRGA